MNYQLIKKQYIEETSSDVSLLKHTKSGARIILFENQDDNKVFSIAFRTPPVDDTGVPHILEHSTLCGSKKFPVKDPFVELLKGSLNTFLNAMTFPDKTAYPVASCNEKDFANLMEVYMDAVLYPNVYEHEEIFKQEGWHYELENIDEPIKYNGVVYNEMKGVFSSPEQSVARASRHALFPDTTYGCESGGDPVAIPNLTYEQFKEFHSRYYHPANSYIVLYGNMNMEEKLEWLDKEYLSKFDIIDTKSSIELQKPFEKPNEEVIEYPVGASDSLENKTYYSFNACIGTAFDEKLSLAFQILVHALFEATGAPLKQALLDASLGTDVMPEFDSSLLQPVFSLIVKDAPAGKLEEFKQVLKDSIKQLLASGLDKKQLLASLNYYEFKMREADFGGMPRGLVYAISLTTWLYDDNNPFGGLEYIETFKQLKEDINSDYFENILRQYLLENKHTAYVTANPSNTLSEEKEKAVAEKLKTYKESLTKEELEQLVKDTKALKEYQATPSTAEELATLPKLTRDDISADVRPLYNEEELIDDIKVVKHNIETNNIGYLKLYFNTYNVPADLIPYLGLLQNVLTKVDTVKFKYQDLSKEIDINTGGIAPSVEVITVSNNECAPYFILDTKALLEKIPFALEMIEEIILNSKFDDPKRLQEILFETKSQKQMMMMWNGHVTSINRAFSYLMKAQNYNELVSGISQYKFIDGLISNFNITEIANKLKETAKHVFRKENLIVSYTGEFKFANEIKTLASKLNTEEIEKVPFEFTPNLLNEGFKCPSQVQFVARCGNFKEAGEYTGAFNVFKVALSYDYLWVQVRVLGGAYGCMTDFNRNGNAFFVSYRDPNLEKTNDVYLGVPAYIDSFNPSEEELTKYVIGAIGNLDTPLSPRLTGNRSMIAYLQGVTIEDIKREREQVLDVTVQDIKNLKPLIEKVLSDNAICTIGNEVKIENSNLFKNKLNLL